MYGCGILRFWHGRAGLWVCMGVFGGGFHQERDTERRTREGYDITMPARNISTLIRSHLEHGCDAPRPRLCGPIFGRPQWQRWKWVRREAKDGGRRTPCDAVCALSTRVVMSLYSATHLDPCHSAPHHDLRGTHTKTWHVGNEAVKKHLDPHMHSTPRPALRTF